MQYQLVIREKNDWYWAFYCPAHKPPVWDFDGEFVKDKTIRGVLKKAKGIEPEDGQVVFTYLDRVGN